MAGVNIMDALVGHPMLRRIELKNTGADNAEMRALAGAVLGRLVAANSPVLIYLGVSNCALGDDGLRPLFAVLPLNTCLHALDAGLNGVSAAFAPDALACVRANRSLRRLHIDNRKKHEDDPGNEGVSIAELRETEALVAAQR